MCRLLNRGFLPVRRTSKGLSCRRCGPVEKRAFIASPQVQVAGSALLTGLV
jgi:hypothetical protein